MSHLIYIQNLLKIAHDFSSEKKLVCIGVYVTHSTFFLVSPVRWAESIEIYLFTRPSKDHILHMVEGQKMREGA